MTNLSDLLFLTNEAGATFVQCNGHPKDVCLSVAAAATDADTLLFDMNAAAHGGKQKNCFPFNRATLIFTWRCRGNWELQMNCWCTTLKATGLLSCLQMKTTSFRMKLKWMWHLREVQLEIPRRSPLSAEMNDASVWRISVPVARSLILMGMTSSQRQPVLFHPEQNVF